MSPALNFKTSAEGGNIPTEGNATAVVMGKAADALEMAGQIAKALLDGKATPVNWMNATQKVAPGGRDPNEIDPELLKGKTTYKPKDDMFGVG